LSGGEIVLDGIDVAPDPGGFAGLCVCAGGWGGRAGGAGRRARSVPHDLIEACRDHRLPLLEVPVDVSFAVITERVMRAFTLPAGPGPAGGTPPAARRGGA
jgi:hypothetical protein